MTLLLDSREGSYELANYEPIRSMLDPCPYCSGEGTINVSISTTLSKSKFKSSNLPCDKCVATGREMYQLSSADVSFVGNGPNSPSIVGIEIKTITDLLSSLENGRLQATQIPKMNIDYTDKWLLIIGSYRPSITDGKLQTLLINYICLQCDKKFCDSFHLNPICPGCKSAKTKKTWENWCDYRFGQGPRPYGYVESFLSGPVLTRMGFQVKNVPNFETAAQWTGVIYRAWSKQWNEHKSMRTVDRSRNLPKNSSMDRKLLDRLEVAMKFPSLGYERALAVAKEFNSIRDMVNCRVDQLAQIQTDSGKRRIKLGNIIAETIIKYLN